VGTTCLKKRSDFVYREGGDRSAYFARGTTDVATKGSSDKIFAESICMMGAAIDIRSKVTEINNIRVPRRSAGLPSIIIVSTPASVMSSASFRT
jgi:hypothetical protein